MNHTVRLYLINVSADSIISDHAVMASAKISDLCVSLLILHQAHKAIPIIGQAFDTLLILLTLFVLNGLKCSILIATRLGWGRNNCTLLLMRKTEGQKVPIWVYLSSSE